MFDSYDLEWLNYVVDCRKGKDISSDYDLVEGGVPMTMSLIRLKTMRKVL